MLSASPSSGFSHKVHNVRFEKQIRILSYLTVIEFRPPVSESSARICEFYDPTNSKHKIHKTRIENWLPIGFELGFPWLRAYSHNRYTIFNLQYDGESQTFLYPSSKS